MREGIEINDLISRFLAGEASPEEAIQLEDWKAASVHNKIYFDSASGIFASESINETAIKQQAWINIKAKIDRQENSTKIVTLKWWKLAIAASFIVLTGIGILLKYSNTRPPKVPEIVVYKTDSSAKKIQLKDGSYIELSANSSITFDIHFSKTNRTILLTGSAFVSVKHDTSLPFVININQLYIKDIGTKFYIHSKSDTVFVTMQEGEVLMYNDFGAKQKLAGNNKARYITSARELKVYTDTLRENKLPGNILNNKKYRKKKPKLPEMKADSGDTDETSSPVKINN